MKNKILISKEVTNSILLSVYMVLIFLYYLISPFRIIAFIFFICYFFLKNKCNKTSVTFVLLFFILSLIIQIINNSLHHFVLFLLIGPYFASWVYKSKFKTSIIRRIFLFEQFLLFILYLKGRTFVGVLSGLSENYISILMISNVVVIACIEIRQNERISIIPSLFGFILSLLTLGRSGIVCSLGLLCLFAYVRFMTFPPAIRIKIMLLILIVTIYIGAKYIDLILEFFNNYELFSKFQERGLKSPSRGILIDEYFMHINFNTFFLGYKFDNNPWFIHYGLNPHNSYIRLHYEIGFAAILLFLYIIFQIYKLYKNKHLILVAMLLIVMVRAYTDVYLFFGFYDFLIFYIFMIGKNYRIEHSIERIHTMNVK